MIVSSFGPVKRSLSVIVGMIGCSSHPMRRVILPHSHTDQRKSKGRMTPKGRMKRRALAEAIEGYTIPLGYFSEFI